MIVNSFNNYLQKRFGRKIYKISLDAGMTCPNRDGKISTGGCIFCSEGGSGDFACSRHNSITKQIEDGKRLVQQKMSNSPSDRRYIAYFQAYTNTYAPMEYLEKVYMEAALNDDIIAISIATRPDCLDKDIMELIYRVHHIKPVFIELGLQTSCEETARYIRRGYNNQVFEHAISLIHDINKKLPDAYSQIHIVVHMIIGLPGETYSHMEDTIHYINSFPIHGIKLQLLHVLKNTDLAKEYEKITFKVLSMEEYTDILIRLLENIRPDIVIHRMTGDGPKKILIAPQWSGNKRMVLNYINKRLSETDSSQGSLYHKHRGDD